MAITPPQDQVWSKVIDPKDITRFLLTLGGASGLLEEGEEMTAYTLDIPPESVLYGLIIQDSGGYEPVVGPDSILIWPKIDDDEVENAAFVSGVTLPMELTIETDFTPPQRFQRTIGITVRQR